VVAKYPAQFVLTWGESSDPHALLAPPSTATMMMVAARATRARHGWRRWRLIYLSAL
jgi:hypothetical protein